MLSPLVESILSQSSAGSITELFLWIILAVLVFALIFAFKEKYKHFTHYAATMMTSIGILGTFAGIVIGLLAFDTSNIDGSIPALLEGLKTAFITSVAGMLAAMVFSFFNTAVFAELSAKRQEKTTAEDSEQGVQPEHIYQALQGQNETLVNIHKGLSGDEEGSLVGQFKMLRAEMTPRQTLDGHLKSMLQQFSQLQAQLDQQHQQTTTHYKEFDQKLFSALKEFSEMMSRAATEQIIEALKNVIQDFNQQLTEQFGENFKALDESVKSLVTWQEQYRLQVEKMGEQYEQSVESLVGTREAVAGIWTECENIPKAMNDLKGVLEVNQHQITELQRHLEAFVTMRDKAVEAVPMLQEQIDGLGQQLASSTETLHNHLLDTSKKLTQGSNEIRVTLEASADHLQDSVTTTQQAFSDMAKEVANSSEGISQTLQIAATEINHQTRDTLNRMQEDAKAVQNEVASTVSKLNEGTTAIAGDLEKLVDSMERYSTSAVDDFKRLGESIAREVNSTFEAAQGAMEGYLQKSVSRTGETINAELELLERATARGISKAIQDMGNQLFIITSRFVEDYEGMVRAMEKVIQTRLDH